jgi:hypothetical protein
MLYSRETVYHLSRRHTTTVKSYITYKITIHSLHSDGTSSQIDEIDIGMPLYNLFVHENGHIYPGAFPDVLALGKTMNDSSILIVPAAVFWVWVELDEDGEPRCEVWKVLEDIEASHDRVLPMTTAAVHPCCF